MAAKGSNGRGKPQLITGPETNPVLGYVDDLPESPSAFLRVWQHGKAADRHLDPFVTSERIPDGTKDGFDDGPRLANTQSLLPQSRDQDAFPDAFRRHRPEHSDPRREGPQTKLECQLSYH